MVHSFAKVGTLNTITPLDTARKPFAWAIIQVPSSNTTSVRIVALDQTAGGTVTPTTGGVVLAPGTGGQPGASLLIPFIGAPLPYDFSNIFIIVGTTNDRVDVIYGS